MKILVLGGYGLIGLAIVRHLHGLGHEVVGLGRDGETGRRAFPAITWIAIDIADHTDPQAWRDHIRGIDCIVNAAGALQDGARDRLDLVQNRAIKALIDCAGTAQVKRFVQISAPGAAPDASTAFLRTKAAADAHLRESSLEWIILKPGLVIGAPAYGGTALIRMLAGLPAFLPLVHGGALVQTVALEDVVACVSRAVAGDIPASSELDLVEAEAHPLRDIVERFRAWLGFPAPVLAIELPASIGHLVAKVADGLGHLGWRSPLRSTALQVLSEDVLGDPAAYRRLTGRDLATLDETLQSLPATVQERWFARLSLAMPLMVLTLSLFWLASGLIGLVAIDAAIAVLPADRVSRATASALVVGGGLADIALGLAILYRPLARSACHGMIALTLGYLVAGTVVAPHLWADPMGVFVKTVPAALLAWVTSLVLEDR